MSDVVVCPPSPSAQPARTYKIAVFGGGSFGTALATCLAHNGHTAVLLTRNEAVVASINETHRNCQYLTAYEVPPLVSATSDAATALAGADYILHCVPVQASPAYLAKLRPLIPPHVPLISASKGLHAETLQYMSEIVPEALGRPQPLAFLSGPSFAKELMERQPTSVVAASEQAELAVQVQRLFVSKSLRVYTSTDVVGVEVGGALKNVFALAAGMAEGLGYGYNTMAMLVTRGCAEMRRLAERMGADPHTLAGLSGIGDLMLTCYGSLSRNRTVGFRLGSGETLQEILDSMKEVVEGIATAKAAVTLAKNYDLDLPIVFTVAAIIKGELEAKEAVHRLMSIPMGSEFA
eukprot:TRINITY_DN23066_c0_g1_i1.p1 TRINITY_DN23066_c0_g1~~TRINITY_DN23066_c0_g1_i1.p1  ORF type:complete len:350 (-),score=114.82 TRINITY_DN23066_c0_g1_i1:187-1236(-)